MNPETTLTEKIRKTIAVSGPLSFRDFMEMALYDPALGYYTSKRSPIGVAGDYYTTPVYTSLFGEMIGKQLEEMWYLTGEGDFTIIEYGAGTGALCKSILDYLKLNEAFYGKLTYCILEKSLMMIEKEKEILCDHNKIKWGDSINNSQAGKGCILSNEMVDNFSVHRVVMGDQLMEVMVGYNDGFVESLVPASESLVSYLDELKIELPKGYRTEINLEATEWISKLAGSLNKGFIITIDYGYPSTELYQECRKEGTLLCYYRHKVNNYPYQYIGLQDITAHVNFSAIAHWGLKNGLKVCGYTNQYDFLRTLGISQQLRLKSEKEANNPRIQSDKNNLNFIYTVLTEMGVRQKVLIQQKGIEGQVPLSGLALSRKSV